VSETLYTRLGGHEGILRLLHPFYADVRQHAILGPVFNAHIHDWPAHLAKIAGFWARQTGGPSAYPGGFAAAHLSLGIGAEHFTHWLRLWDINCRRNLAEAEARELSALAHTLAERLQSIGAGRGGMTIV
jgi:hemoglobin